MDKIAKVVYGADGVRWSPEAEAKAKSFEADPKYDEYATMMVKTHLSLTHDPNLKGVPKGWTLPIRDILIYSGAKFLCPMAGNISLMPGYRLGPGLPQSGCRRGHREGQGASRGRLNKFKAVPRKFARGLCPLVEFLPLLLIRHGEGDKGDKVT